MNGGEIINGLLGALFGAGTLIAFAIVISRIFTRVRFERRRWLETGLETYLPEGFGGQREYLAGGGEAGETPAAETPQSDVRTHRGEGHTP